MSDTIQLPTLKFFQWGRPEAPNPRLLFPIGLTDTTIQFTSPPLDEDDEVITDAFIFGVKNAAGYVENIFVPAGELSADGLTAENVVRGISLTGLDYNTKVDALVTTHEQDSPVFCNVTGVYESILMACIRGASVRSNGLGFIMGTGAEETVTISRDDTTVKGFLRWDAGTGQSQFSNDGSAWVNLSTPAGSSLTAITAADTSPGYLDDKLVLGDNDFITKTVLDPGGGETLELTVPNTLIQNNTATYATTAGTSTAYTLTLTPAPVAYAAGQEFHLKMHTTSGATPTLNVNGLGAKNIFNAATLAAVSTGALVSGALVVVEYDGTQFQVTSFVATQPPVQTTYDVAGSPHTWTKPAKLTYVRVQAWGAGGSGGSSAGRGGGGGAYNERIIMAASLGTTETVTIGAGGAAVINNTGNVGGNSSFGTHLVVYGGGGGGTGAGTGGGGGAGILAVGAVGSSTGGAGGSPLGGAGGSSAVGGDSNFGGGGGGDTNFAGGLSVYGGGGGGGGESAPGTGGNSVYGGGGGGGGDTTATPIDGGTSLYGGAGGTGGDASPAPTAGTVPGGGGGGQADAGLTSGAGGAGRIIVTEYFN